MTILDAAWSDKRLSGEEQSTAAKQLDSTHCLLKTYGAWLVLAVYACEIFNGVTCGWYLGEVSSDELRS